MVSTYLMKTELLRLYVSKGSQGHLGLSFAKWDQNYCRVPAKKLNAAEDLESRTIGIWSLEPLGFRVSNHWDSLEWVLNHQIFREFGK